MNQLKDSASFIPDFTKQTTLKDLKVDLYTLYCRNYVFYNQILSIYIRVPCLTILLTNQISFHCGLRMALRVQGRTSGVRDITYTSWNRTSIPKFQVPTFHQPPTPICHMFSYTKSHRTNYVIHHRCPLSYYVRYQCQLLYCNTSTFPPRQFWRSLSSNKGTTSSKSVKHTCSYPDQGALVVFLKCVSRLWGNDKHPKKYSAPPKLWNFLWGCSGVWNFEKSRGFS